VAVVIMIQGMVEVSKAGSAPATWQRVRLNEILQGGDRLRTGERSRAAIRLSNGIILEKGELSEIEIPLRSDAIFHIFNRDRATTNQFKIHPPSLTNAIRG